MASVEGDHGMVKDIPVDRPPVDVKSTPGQNQTRQSSDDRELESGDVDIARIDRVYRYAK